MTDWFSSLTNQAKQLADSLTETIVTQAAVAKDEFEQEQRKLKEEVEKSRIRSSDDFLLPWETRDESLAILTQDLMEKVLKLSLSDRNFTVESPQLSEFQMIFKDYVPVIMKLLSIDSNLSRIHAKLSPKMNEEIFWMNYYQRCMYLRSIQGFEGQELKNKYSSIPIDSIIFLPSFEADYNVRKDLTKHHIEEKTVNKQISGQTVSLNNSTNNQMKKSDEDAKLVAEVEEELNNDDINLDDLADITGDDEFENIGEDDIDDDLEAQIARELGEDDM